MSEKLTAKQAAEQLLYKPEYAADKSADVKEKAAAFAEGYKAFLNAAKTEREAAAASEKLLLEAGYEKFEPKKTYAPGQKIYFVQEHKAVVAATIGRKSFEEGFRLVIAHIDSPRLDLRPNPLYEANHLSYFKTHYYGGIRKYQWVTIPLELHGVVVLRDGSKVDVHIGGKEDDPQFIINDLLPHLGREQGKKPLNEAIPSESLNVLLGGKPFEDKDCSDRFKLGVLQYLNVQYGITEEDFISAELEVVPAGKARDIGFDRALIGSYGHDDRVCAYPALRAILDTDDTTHTQICVLADKEEIGSEGTSGMQCVIITDILDEIAKNFGVLPSVLRENSLCLSADVTAGYDPAYASAFEEMNAGFVNSGVTMNKFTGARGKSGSNDASAEYIGYLRGVFAKENIVWQTGELGRVDLGGGGTVAKFIANMNIDTVDMGVPVLSMHAPYELISKADLYTAHKAFSAFVK